MASRSRRSWKPDSRGYYFRALGWERSRSGKLQQHKFLLGTDRKAAEVRERKLRELWDAFCEGREEARPLWPEDLLVIAKRIAAGTPEIPIPRGPYEKQYTYAARIQRMQAKYPVVLFKPEDQYAYEVGQAALEVFEQVPTEPMVFKSADVEVHQAIEEAKQRLIAAGLTFSPELGILAQADDIPTQPLPGAFKPGDPATRRVSQAKAIKKPSPSLSTGEPSGVVRASAATLYQAFRAYQKYLDKEYHDPRTERVSPWGKTQIRQVKNLTKHHSDTLLSKLDADAVHEMVGYWRRRPCKIGTKDPMTAKSSSNFLGTLLRFFKWLDRSSQFSWTKPCPLSDLDTRVKRLVSDHARKSVRQVDTFSLEELKLLMRYGQPFERLLVLLGLNCGFGRAEIASLLVGEVHLFTAHSPRDQEILGYTTTDDDSFIKRIRRKSGVYGEHLLFPMTVAGIEWALERRKKFPAFGPEARLVVSEKGTAVDQQTKGNNANQLIPNHFDRLIKQIRDDGNEIQKLSFNKLRKTATDLVKRFSDGEIAGVFDCHGSPVKTDSLSDVYSNRPFGKVFKAIRAVEEYLAPVFFAAGPRPFAPQLQAYTKKSTIERAIKLHEEGMMTGQIAASLGLSGVTVSRYIREHREQARPTTIEDGRSSDLRK
jgi:hypothetical protein